MPKSSLTPGVQIVRALGPSLMHGSRYLVAALALIVLVGCGAGSRCGGSDQPYLSARNLPLLRVPAEMEIPDRSGMLQIPDGPAEAPRQVVDGHCIDEPPSYFGSAGAVAGSAEEAVAIWASAWAARDTAGVRSAYSQRFEAPGEGPTAEWLEQRVEQVATGPVPTARVEDLEIATVGADQRVARFVQRFGSNALRKELVLIREGATWRILSERVIEVL